MLLNIVILVFLAAPPGGDAEAALLIAKLADDSQVVRDRAEKALVALGRPALLRLLVAMRSHDLEMRMRALRAATQIDPVVKKRWELERLIAALRAEVMGATGYDASRWGEDVVNPLANLTAEGKKKLATEGVDAIALTSVRAVMITGNYRGAYAITLVNKDPNTMLVLGKGFIPSGKVLNAGPVLAIDNVRLGLLTVAAPALFVETSIPVLGIRAAPLLVETATSKSWPTGWVSPEVRARLVVEELGWRRPVGWPKRPAVDLKGPRPALAAVDARKKRADLLAEVRKATGTDTKEWCKPTPNPLTRLSDEGNARLRLRGVDVVRLAKLKAVLLTGSHCGARTRHFINRDPDTLLIVGKGFITDGDLYSAGPVLAIEDAQFRGNVTGADVVWFVDHSFPRGVVKALPAIVSRTAIRWNMSRGCDDIWHGDYGWPTKYSE